MKVMGRVTAMGFLGFLVMLSSGTAVGQEGVRTPVSPQERVASACQSAEEAFGAGDVNGGCKTLLDALRSLDPDRSELVDLTTAPLHLLIFGMCSLMDDNALAGFLANSIDPQANPIDDALLLFFNVDYRTLAEGRDVPAAPLAEQVQRAQRMEQSSHALVRALGLMALSWYAPGDVVGDSTRTAFNRLAELCPDAKSTREVLHRLLLVTAGPDPAHSQAMRDLVNRPDWNPAVQALIADDPVVALVREVATDPAQTVTLGAEKSAIAVNPADSGIASVLTAAQNHSEAEVKDWCLRLVHANAGDGTAGVAAFPEAVRVQYETVAKSGASNLKSVSAVAVEVQPLEALRARHVLFTRALDAQDLTAAGIQLDALLSASSAEEPLDSNTHQNALIDAVEYGMRLVVAGEYTKALAVFERIARKYPNSDAGNRGQEHVDHIKAVLAIEQK